MINTKLQYLHTFWRSKFKRNHHFFYLINNDKWPCCISAANSAACNLVVQFASAGWNTVPDQPCLLNHWSDWEELVSICASSLLRMLSAPVKGGAAFTCNFPGLVSRGRSLQVDKFKISIRGQTWSFQTNEESANDQQENNQLMLQLNRV